MANKLEEFGYNFQIKVLSSLIHDKTFLQQTADIIELNHFDNPSHKWVLENIIYYYNEHRSTPTMEVFRVELDKIKDEVSKIAIKEQLKDIFLSSQSSDLDYVKKNFLNFCKNQALKNALLKSVNLLADEDYEGIRTIIDGALKAGIENNLGHDYNISIEERYLEEARNAVNTPWNEINALLQGGLGKGDLGVLMGNPGGGKSWLLVALGARALSLGYNVLHYTLELSDTYVGKRYDACLTQIPVNEVGHHKELIKTKLSELKGKLYIKEYPSNAVGLNTIRAHFEKCKGQDFKPDLVILDYADLIYSKAYKEKRDNIGDIYTTLRGMARELEVPIWTVSQANRSGARSEIIEGDQIADSYDKLKIADFLASVSRTTEDKQSGEGRLHIVKNRYGEDGITYNTNIDLSNGNFEILGPTTISSGSKNNTSNITSDERQRIQKLANENPFF